MVSEVVVVDIIVSAVVVVVVGIVVVVVDSVVEVVVVGIVVVVVDSVLGCPIEEEDLPKLIGFLKRQETNGKFFSKAMQKEPLTDMEEV